MLFRTVVVVLVFFFLRAVDGTNLPRNFVIFTTKKQ